MTLGPIYRRGAGIAIVAGVLVIVGPIVRNRVVHHSLEPAPQSTKRQLVISGSDAGYVDSSACSGCHRQIWESYQQTGMGRSWSRIRPDIAADFKKNNTFYHPASDRFYKMYSADGKYYQRRHQLDRDGKE